MDARRKSSRTSRHRGRRRPTDDRRFLRATVRATCNRACRGSCRDYLALDPGGHRLFSAHGTRVLVVDTDKLAVAGEIADTPGVHGIALAPDLGRGYISAGRAGLIVVFDLHTLARLKEIKTTGENPDAILYDAASQRVFTFNGRGRNATAVDARTDAVIGTIALDAKPEFAVADGKGRIYVNLEDKSSLAVIDPRKLSVISVWPISGCQEPSGLALDAAGGQLFPVCDNKVMAVMGAASGQGLGSAPVGGGGGAGGGRPPPPPRRAPPRARGASRRR